MIIRNASLTPERVAGSRTRHEIRLGREGGLSALGANVVILQPGEFSSDRHWHAESDEFLYVLDGIATIVDDDGPHDLSPGDCVCWPAGVPNAHTVTNRSTSAIRFLVVGTNPAKDRVRYPDSKQTLYHEPPNWRVVGDDGTVLREGTIEAMG